MEVRYLLQKACCTKCQKVSGSHSKLCFTSAKGKAALTTEKKNFCVLHILMHAHAASKWMQTLIAKVHETIHQFSWIGLMIHE